MAVLDAGTEDRASEASQSDARPHTVGPNAIIQTRSALDERVGSDKRRAIFDAAGLGRFADDDPRDMVEVSIVNVLNRQIAAGLDAETSHDVMQRAGELTGDYILANRIPKPAQWLLKHLPRTLAQRMLMAAIARNAWTFAGHAKVETGHNLIAIRDNPVCLGKVGFSSCIWHRAVFERLLQSLIDPTITMHETECVGWSWDACRFEIVKAQTSARRDARPYA